MRVKCAARVKSWGQVLWQNRERSVHITLSFTKHFHNSFIYKAFPCESEQKTYKMQEISLISETVQRHLRTRWASTTDSLLPSPGKRGLLSLWISHDDIFSLALKRKVVWSLPLFYALNNFDKDGKRIKCISVMSPFSTFAWLKEWQGIGPRATVTLCQHQSQQTAHSRL